MFFARLDMSEDELLDDSEAIAGLEVDPTAPPLPVKRSIDHAFRFPPQEFKLGVGAQVIDPRTGQSAGTLVPAVFPVPLPDLIAMRFFRRSIGR